MVSGGLENFKRDAMTFVLKITAVVALTNNMSLILESMFDIQDGLILAATGYVSTGSFLTGFSKLHCSMSLDIWMRADCLINLIIGVRVPAVSADIVSSVYNGADYTTVANSMLQSGGNLDDGLLAFFWNCLMSGSVLTLAALIGMYMVFNLILGLLKAANIYLMSMMGMAFMAIMGGILLPLMIMRSTYEYFDNWAKNFLSVMLQPIVLFAFLNVAFTAFDVILVSGKSSLLHVVAGNAVDNTEGGFTMNKYLASTGAVVREDMGCYNADLNHSAYSKDQQVVAVRDYGAEIRQPIEPVPQAKAIVEGDRPNDPRDFKVCIPSKVIDPLVLAARRDPPVVLQQGNDSEEQFIMELAGAFVMAWLTSYVFVMMLDMIPGLAKKLSGGGSGAALA